MQENNVDSTDLDEVKVDAKSDSTKLPMETNKENRKTRRMKAKLARMNPLPVKRTNWVERIVGEMKENTKVVTKVVDGKLDKFLKKV